MFLLTFDVSLSYVAGFLNIVILSYDPAITFIEWIQSIFSRHLLLNFSRKSLCFLQVPEKQI